MPALRSASSQTLDWGIGGDLASSALATASHPAQDRTAGTVIGNALSITMGSVANTLSQEFLLSKFPSWASNAP